MEGYRRGAGVGYPYALLQARPSSAAPPPSPRGLQGLRRGRGEVCEGCSDTRAAIFRAHPT